MHPRSQQRVADAEATFPAWIVIIAGLVVGSGWGRLVRRSGADA